MEKGQEEVAGELEHVQATLAETKERADLLRAEVAALEERLRIARGTGELEKEAREAREIAAAAQLPPPVPARAPTPIKPSLAQLIEMVLKTRVATTEDLSRETGFAKERVLAEIKKLRRSIADVGSAERARWTWRLGNDVPPQELRALVERLITCQPMEFRELLAATGSRPGLIQGHLIELRKVREVVDLGSPGRARWFIVPPGARDARIQPRRG